MMSSLAHVAPAGSRHVSWRFASRRDGLPRAHRGVGFLRRRTGVTRGVVITRAAFLRVRESSHSNTGEGGSRAPGDAGAKFDPPKRDLGLGDIGSDVENLQRAMGMKMFDGVYGEDTVAAVKKWQEANRIQPTGFFGEDLGSASSVTSHRALNEQHDTAPVHMSS